MPSDQTRTQQTDLGTVEERGGRHLLRYERHLAHPPERVWGALTDPDELRGWLASADELELRPGGRVVLRWLNTDDEGNTAIARGTVTACDPPSLLEFDTDIHGRLRFELSPEGSGCALTFTADVELPPNYVTMVPAGWHVHLDFLADALDGRPIEDWDHWPRDRWERVHDAYVARLAT